MQFNANIDVSWLQLFAKIRFVILILNCVQFIYLLAFRPLLSKAVNRLPQIYNNRLQFPLFGFFVFPLP